jgi:MFS transporter, SP family, xylose:H+ symportor
MANAGAVLGTLSLTGPLNSGNGIVGGIAALLGLYRVWICAINMWWPRASNHTKRTTTRGNPFESSAARPTVIDKLGRRKLMLVGSIGYLISLGFLAGLMFYYEQARDGQFTSTSAVLVLVGLMVFIAAHAFGQGSVIWVFISEIFPNRIRGRGQSLGSLTHWVFAAITSFAFPPIIGAFGAGFAFSIFFVAMIGQLVWVLRVMPETKGVPLEEMEAKLGLTHVTFPPATERDR